jgi:hypothetical protein
MRSVLTVLPFLLLCISGSLPAQTAGSGKSGRRALLPRDQEILLARSAAPPSVSDSARILVLTDRGFEVAVPGTTTVTCITNRSWPDSLEPSCFDAEASQTVLPVELYRTEERHKGRADADIEREISDRLADGRFRLPRRPALQYMLSSAQQLISDDGRRVGKWYPHMMLSIPYLTNGELGLPEAMDMRVGVVSDSGKPWATLVTPVRAFVDPAPAAGRSP